MGHAIGVSFDNRGHVSYFLKVSLHHRAVVKIAVTLWTEHYLVNSSICNMKHDKMKSVWKPIERNLLEKANELNLEASLRQQVQYIVQLIGFRILAWVHFHEYYGINIQIPERFFWTPRGTIDLTKTAEFILENSKDLNNRTRYRLNNMERYRLACIYCLIDKAYEFWKELYFKHKNFEKDIDSENFIIIFWNYALAQKLEDLKKLLNKQTSKIYDCLCELVLSVAVSDCNEPATRYFLQIFTDERKGNVAMNHVSGIIKKRKAGLKSPGSKEEHYCDVMCYLLSTLTLDQQKKIFFLNSSPLLGLFLEWPWQDYFMQAVEYMGKDIGDETYEDVLLLIYGKIHNGYKDYNYKNLLQAFWEKRTKYHETYFIGVPPTSPSTSRCPDKSGVQSPVVVSKKRTKILHVRHEQHTIQKIHLLNYLHEQQLHIENRHAKRHKYEH